LIVSIISLGILASFSLVSSEIGTIFTNMADTLSAAME
jgi:Flp pilus assembly pilin Flp